MRALELISAFVVTSCARPAPAAAPVPVPPDASAATHMAAADTATGHNADVTFMQGMIAHHAQALVMAGMVSARTNREDMKLLAERISVSQKSEIEMMQAWLRNHHAEVPGDDAHFHMEAGHMTPMPGMLTADELAQLQRASGAEFDRLFLQYMVRHHEGALTMVAKLFGTRGAAQASDVYRFASDVDADQRAEIARMQNLQRELR